MGPTNNPYYSLITPQLNVSFVPDVWGANRRAVESLAAQERSQKFQLEATYLTLTANVVAGAVQEASLRGQIAATRETIKIESALLDILRRQMALGQMAGADVAAQEAALAQAQLQLPPLQKQLAQQRDALTALAGRYPSEEVAETFDLRGSGVAAGPAGQPPVQAGGATAGRAAGGGKSPRRQRPDRAGGGRPHPADHPDRQCRQQRECGERPVHAEHQFLEYRRRRHRSDLRGVHPAAQAARGRGGV